MSILQGEMRVRDVAIPVGKFPLLPPKAFLKTALEEMGKTRLGIVCIADDDLQLQGILTDGDIRRQLLRMQKPFSAFFGDDVIDHAMRDPTTVRESASLMDAVVLMERKQVWDLPVIDEAGRLAGLLHLHPVVQALLGIKS